MALLGTLLASTSGFETGKKIAIVFLAISAVLFLSTGLGKRFGTMPKSGSSLGAVQSMLVLRWVSLSVGVVGLSVMLINL